MVKNRRVNGITTKLSFSGIMKIWIQRHHFLSSYEFNMLLRNIVGLDDSLARRQQAGYANKKLMKMSNEAKSRDYEAPELVFPVPYQMLSFSTYRVEALCKAALHLLLQFQTVKSRSSIY